MGTFSFADWLIVVVVFGVPILAVETERSGKAVRRREFARWLACIIAVEFTLYMIARSDIKSAALILGAFGAHQFVTFFLYRFLVQRSRDAGIGKWLAYLAVIPIINLIVIVYLSFKKSRPAYRRRRDLGHREQSSGASGDAPNHAGV